MDTPNESSTADWSDVADSAKEKADDDPPAARWACPRWCKGWKLEYWLHIIRRLVWLAAVITCSAFMVTQMMDCLEKLSNPPVSMQTRVQVRDDMIYPAITLCFKNLDYQGYHKPTLLKFNVSGYWITDGTWANRVWTNFDFAKHTLDELWTNATYLIHLNARPLAADDDDDDSDVEDDDEPDTYSEEEETPFIKVTMAALCGKIDTVDLKTHFYHEHGRCTTFRPKVGLRVMPGENDGYKILLQHSAIRGSFNLFIHDPEEYFAENPLLSYYQRFLNIPSTQKTYVTLEESEYRYLDRNDFPCDENPPLSYTECFELCRWESIVASPGAGCSTPFMPVEGLAECNTYDTLIKTMDLYRNWTNYADYKERCSSRCLRSCTSTHYVATVVRSVEVPRVNQSQFFIYFQSGIIQQLQEEWGYDVTLFIADFGGSLGFLLGVSILSVLEIVEGLIFSTYRIIRKRTNTKIKRKTRKELKKQARAAALATSPLEPTTSKQKEATASSTLEVPPGTITVCRSGSLKRRKTEAAASTASSSLRVNCAKKEMEIARTESNRF